jgi:asparagine synthase (glutamine-hydrolysing)
MDRAIGLTSRAVAKRRSSAPFALPLSGGRDSRHILLCLVDSGCYPEFVVTVPRFPPAAPEDERIAALVAASLHLRHVLVPQTSHRATAEARKNITTSYCADEHAWFYAMLDVLSEPAPVVYEGIGGSLWTIGWLADRSSRDLWQAGRTREVASRLLGRYQIIGEAFLTDVLSADRFSRDIAIERLSRELDRHVGAPDPGKSFHFWNRLRRELALIPFGEMHQRGEVLTPLVDRELVEFLLALAPEVVSSSLSRSDKSFHSDALQRAFPAAADLPFERPDAPRIDAGAHDRALTRSVALYLVNRRKPLRLMRTACAVPRIVYTMLNRRYAASTRWLATTALYLSQLEDAAS